MNGGSTLGSISSSLQDNKTLNFNNLSITNK